ncbi:hypothetical protein EOM82_04925 [bacterium]|nr:hypothetical protein [bacterium]
MQTIKDFLTSKTPITDTINVPNWLFLVLIVVLVLLVIIIISATKNSKKSNVKEKSPIGSNPEVIPFLDEDKPQESDIKDNMEITFIQDVAVVSPKAEEKTEEETSVIPQEASASDTVSRRNKLSHKTIEEPITLVNTPEIEETTHLAVAPTVIEEVLAAEEQKAETIEIEEQPVVDTEKKVEGKFEICNSDLGGYRYLLRANNGQLLYESRDYKSVDSCSEAINKFINAVKNGDFSVKADKFDRFKFILKSPTSNNTIYTGESFANNAACLSNIESVKRFALASEVYDLTEEDYAAKSKAFEIDEEIKASINNPNGAVGKWVIETEVNNGKTVYIYLLYANNGQLLYESRDYASYASCKNGLETFIKTVRDGEFIIDPDKAGRYKFILRSKNKNSMVEYLGQNYSTQKAAESSAESVYKFALVSSIENL